MFSRLNNKNKKKKSLLLVFLYLAIALFIIWLLMISLLTYLFSRDEINENALLNKIYALPNLKKGTMNDILGTPNLLDEKGKSEIRLNEQYRDEFLPAMEDLLKDRDFDQERFDSIFDNMKSPKGVTEDSLHSTFGRDVIYIYHSHSRESFLPYLIDTDKPENAYHSKANITVVGEMLGRALEQRGVGTKVDSTDIVQELNLRGLDFGSSYKLSGERVRAASAESKDLEIFLDIHRDSLRKNSTTQEINGESFARLLFVVGTGHENFARNLSYTEGLDSLLSTEYPGLSKGILKKDSSRGNGVYNQDISPNAVIIEIGGVDNTLEELQRTTEALADVLSDYYWHREK